MARPPSVTYRTARFARRHRWGVSFAATLAALLVGGTGVLSLQAARLADERDTAREMAAFLERLFEATDPYQEGRRDTLNISQFVRLSAQRVREELDDQPRVQARLLVLTGRVFRNLGRFDEAHTLLEDGARLFEEVAGEASDEAIGARGQLAHVLRDVGEPAAAAELFEHVVAAQRVRAAAGARAQLGLNLLGLGNARQDTGDFPAAEAAYAEGAEVLAAALPPDDPRALQALNNLGTVRVRRADFVGAESAFREARERGSQALGDDHPTVLQYGGNLAYVLRETGRVEEALALNLEILERARRRFPGPSPIVARLLNNLGSAHLEAGRPGDAETYLQEAVAMRREALGEEHPDVATSLSNLGVAWLDQGRTAEADGALASALGTVEGTLGPDHPRAATILTSLARIAHDGGNHHLARDRLLRAERIRAARLGDDHPSTAAVRLDLGRDLLEVGDAQEARRALVSAYRRLREDPRDEDRLRLALGYLIDLCVRTGDGAGAVRYQEELAALSAA